LREAGLGQVGEDAFGDEHGVVRLEMEVDGLARVDEVTGWALVSPRHQVASREGLVE